MEWKYEAVFLGFGVVSAQAQAAAGMRLRQSLAKTQKSSLKTASLFLETLQTGREMRGRPRLALARFPRPTDPGAPLRASMEIFQ